MPGLDVWRHFADMRVLYGYQMTRPGAKLTFMGDDFGQSQEWSYRLIRSIEEDRSLSAVQWEELDRTINPVNAERQLQLQHYFRERNNFYFAHPALWKDDAGFKWINERDQGNSTISFSRHDNEGHHLICVHNFSPNGLNYVLKLPNEELAPEWQKIASIQEVFNSDLLEFGGTGRRNAHVEIIRNGKEVSLKFYLPPLATLVFEPTLSE